MSDPGAVFGTPSAQPIRDLKSAPDNVIGRLDLEQMMSLVDSILPFEACLYYQVIPLCIEATHLHVGMVNLDDTSANDYVRRQIAYINYSLVTWPISSDWHREMLSKFLSHKAKTKQNNTQPDPNPVASNPKPIFPVDPADQATYIVDSPSTLPESEAEVSKPSQEKTADKTEQLPDRRVNIPSRSAQAPTVKPSVKRDLKQPLDLNVPPLNPSINLTAIRHLPPKKLAQVLLNRVLQDGIGRLYFEHRETTGRILWSKDGIVQAALDDLSLPLFQNVINEFKRLTHLPLLPATKTKQVEIERTYRQERVVLRFRLIAGSHGEEATLQVLRGAALKFYQQQQIDQLGQNALTFAHRLQEQINQIRDRSERSLTLDGMPAHTLNAISHLLKDIDTEISSLMQEPQQD